MVFKSESYNLGLNKKDTTIQGIKLKPITRTDAFKHSVKKNTVGQNMELKLLILLKECRLDMVTLQ